MLCLHFQQYNHLSSPKYAIIVVPGNIYFSMRGNNVADRYSCPIHPNTYWPFKFYVHLHLFLCSLNVY